MPVFVDQLRNASEEQIPVLWEIVINVARMMNAQKQNFVALVNAEVCYFWYSKKLSLSAEF